MIAREVLYGGATRAGRTDALIEAFVKSDQTMAFIATPTKHRANVLAKQLRKAYRLRATPKRYVDTSHVQSEVSYDGEICRMLPDVREYFGVEVVK